MTTTHIPTTPWFREKTEAPGSLIPLAFAPHLHLLCHVVVVQNICPQDEDHSVGSLFGQDPLSRICIPNGPFFARTLRTTPMVLGLGFVVHSSGLRVVDLLKGTLRKPDVNGNCTGTI